eukprot:m51a1_g10723 putative nitrite reductase (236) ;mRNA; f:241434-243210
MPRKPKSPETKAQQEQRLLPHSEKHIRDAQGAGSATLSAQLSRLTDDLARAVCSRRPTQGGIADAGIVRALTVAHALCRVTGEAAVLWRALEVPAMPPEPPEGSGSGGYKLVMWGWRRGNTWSTPIKGTKKEGNWVNKSGNSKRDDVWVNYWKGPRGQRMLAFYLPGRNDRVIAMADKGPEDIVCPCNQVTKATITEAIAHGCKTVEEIGEKTTAGTVCGACLPEITEILESTPK